MRVSSEEWKRLRVEVFERDYYRCRAKRPDGRICLQGPPKTQIQCAHILARKNGGSDEMINLITKCVECHAREHPWMFRYLKGTAKNLVNVVKVRMVKNTLRRASLRIATS
jgi:5-methylcytosine-specific restriction endonuclease McrA